MPQTMTIENFSYRPGVPILDHKPEAFHRQLVDLVMTGRERRQNKILTAGVHDLTPEFLLIPDLGYRAYADVQGDGTCALTERKGEFESKIWIPADLEIAAVCQQFVGDYVRIYEILSYVQDFKPFILVQASSVAEGLTFAGSRT